MAKIKLKFGENEIEIDSRDFYLDNQTLGDVIRSISKHIEENKAQWIFTEENTEQKDQIYQENLTYLNKLENVEIHEPEYNPPIPIMTEEIKDKLKILEEKSFFDKPRTVSETVSELMEHGWSASPLYVSKVLAKMALNKEIIKNSYDDRSYYVTKKALLTN